jgi:hypothetical protein
MLSDSSGPYDSVITLAEMTTLSNGSLVRLLWRLRYCRRHGEDHSTQMTTLSISPMIARNETAEHSRFQRPHGQRTKEAEYHP